MGSNSRMIIHCSIDRDTHTLLLEHCERTGQTKTTAVKRAIRAYCEKNIKSESKSEGEPV